MNYPLNAREGFTFGADPEIIILNEKGVPVSAAGLIPGTKEEPFRVKNGAVQVDGMLAEFNIDPAADFRTFSANVNSVMKQLLAMLPSGYSFSQEPAVEFDPEVFSAAPDTAKELGCTPDFDAWTGDMNPPPADPENPYLRCAAGHLHYGWTDGADVSDADHMTNCLDIVRQSDWYLGAWSTRIDGDPRRRRLYGKAGAYRPKPYGCEYRVLSNFWIFSRDRQLQVWNRMQLAVKSMAKNYIPENKFVLDNGYNDRLIASINDAKRDPVLEGALRYPVVTTDYLYKTY